MQKVAFVLSMAIVSLSPPAYAAPVGAVLYREGSPVHYSHYNVPSTAAHHYFGYLEGPAWENRYCAYRVYVDKDNRNALDFISKYSPSPVLHYFDDPAVDEHTNFSWGTDCFSISTTMGLGPFRLFNNNQWLNPQMGVNLDSLVIAIVDSSTQTPKASIIYYGWNIGSGEKLTVTWIMSTTLDERPGHCEVTISGNYSGKVVVGITNNNKRGHPVTVIQDSTKALLATIGRQGGVGEGFTDTLLLAVHAEKSYFSAFAEDAQNYGMVLTPDSDKKVKWSIASCWAKETSPIFRNPDWQNQLFSTVTRTIRENVRPAVVNRSSDHTTASYTGLYSLSGKKMSDERGAAQTSPHGLFLLRTANGCLVKKAICSEK
jgi:hypothetical protein